MRPSQALMAGWLTAKSYPVSSARIGQIGDHRNVGHGRPLADGERVSLQVLLEDSKEVVEPSAKMRQHVLVRRSA